MKINNQLLSENFKDWYSETLSLIFNKNIAIEELKVHPHFFILNKRISSKKKTLEIISKKLKKTTKKVMIVSSSKKTNGYFSIFKRYSLVEYLRLMPLITSADILQNPHKICSLLTLDLKSWFAVVEVKDFDDYCRTLLSLKRLTKKFNSQKISKIKLSIVKDWILIKEGKRAFFISKFLGQTFEQDLKKYSINKATKTEIIKCLNKFALFSESERLYWRDLAPRNMFLSENKKEITLIDFENLFNTTEMTPLTRIYWDKFRRVWFGDVLDKNEIDLIYKNLPTFSIDQSKMLDADLFEKNYFNKKKIDTRSHLDFLELTANFEKRHVLAKNIVYGHRLGLYLSDFHSSDDESKVYLAMRDFSSKDWDGFLLELQKAVDTEQQNYLISIYTNKKRTDEVCEVLNKVKGK